MLTGADEYPFHQTPEPMAYAGTDRNFYDRFFYNGYSEDFGFFFAAALGVYPQLDVMDASFCIVINNKQYNVRASKWMRGERSVLEVGPISIEIINPLKSSRIIVTDRENGVTADLTFEARHTPIEEPRFIRRVGTRVMMDYTRLTQNISWSGTVTVDGTTHSFKPGELTGTRDRSWGIRPVGASDPQPPKGGGLKQFYWLWTPANFDHHVAFCHTNDDEFGRPWNRRGVIQPLDGEAIEYDQIEFDYAWQPGTRRLAQITCNLSGEAGEAQLRFVPQLHFYMQGLGYMHPIWGHGHDHGDLETGFDVIDLSTSDDLDPALLHIQALSTAELEIDGQVYKGQGVVEQLFVGPHEPTGMGDGLELVR